MRTPAEPRLFLGQAAAVVAEFLNRFDSETSLGEHRSHYPQCTVVTKKPNETGANKTLRDFFDSRDLDFLCVTEMWIGVEE